ncbi:unnamed protein product [Lathyrus sativus]|nr:unnamed protein product [Lathyrus sativus]
MLLGLRVDGKAINGTTEVTNSVYMDYLGKEPTETDKMKGFVKITWIESEYENLKNIDRPTQEDVLLEAKLFILLVIATVLFPDKTQNLLHSSWVPFVGDLIKCGTYSWGSACLAKLYREMCKAAEKDVRSMSGCALLLTSWAFTRIPLFAPINTVEPSFPYAQRWTQRGMNYRATPRFHLQGYRNALDHMQEKDFIWRPYIQYPVPRLEDSQIWSTTTYLVCFYIIEMHQSDRVTLQFGFDQQIPPLPRCLKEHHAITMRKAQKVHWQQLNKDEVREWRHRRDVILQGGAIFGERKPSQEYLTWFRAIPYVHVAPDQFLTDPRTQASSSTQQTPASMHQHVPPTQTSQFGGYPSSSAQHNYNFPQFAQQYQPQPYLRPPRQFTPCTAPNFEQSNPYFQYPTNPTFNTTFSQPAFTPDDVYIPTIQQPQADTYPQPPQPSHSFQHFLLTEEQLTQMPDFNIEDILNDDEPGPSSRQTIPPRTHHNEDLSSDSSQSAANERLGRGYRQRRPPRCGTGGHLR